MSHTPGPWSYEEPGWDGLPHLMAANGEVVATLFLEPKNCDIPLIAAAPELYGALEKLFDMMISNRVRNNEGVRRLQMAADVLAKVPQ